MTATHRKLAGDAPAVRPEMVARCAQLVDEATDHNLALAGLMKSDQVDDYTAAIAALLDAQGAALCRLNNLLAGEDEEGNSLPVVEEEPAS